MNETPRSLDGFRPRPVLNDELVDRILTTLPALSGETRIGDLIPYLLEIRQETEALAPWRAVIDGLDSGQKRVFK